MIQPGQKLKEGDYFQRGTIEQYTELLAIENFPNTDYAKYCLDDGGITVVSGWIFDIELVSLKDGKTNAITEYNFADFKKLCENTFGDGSV